MKNVLACISKQGNLHKKSGTTTPGELSEFMHVAGGAVNAPHKVRLN